MLTVAGHVRCCWCWCAEIMADESGCKRAAEAEAEARVAAEDTAAAPSHELLTTAEEQVGDAGHCGEAAAAAAAVAAPAAEATEAA